MKLKFAAIAVLAALALAGCGGKGGTKGAVNGAAADAAASSPLDKPFSLADAKELDVDKFFALFPERMKIAYESKSFDKKLGATVVKGLTIGEGRHDAVSIDRAEFYGVNLDMIDQIKSAENAALDAPMRRIFEQIRLYGVKDAIEDGENAKLSIGAIELDRLSLREGGVPKETDAAGVAAVFNAFEAAGVYFKDISVDGRPARDSGDVAFKAADARLVGIGGGKLGAFIARDVDYSLHQSEQSLALLRNAFGPAGATILKGPLRNMIAPDSQRVKAKTFVWNAIDLSGLLDWGLKGEEPPITARNLIDLGNIRIDDAEMFVGDKRASIVPETIVSDMKFEWLAPSKIRAVTRGGVTDFTAYLPDDAAKEIAVLKSHGLDKAKIASSLSYDWSADRGDAVVKAEYLSKQLSDFDFNLSLGGLQLEKIAKAEEAGEKDSVAKLGKLKSMSMKIADHNMLDALFELAALQNGSTAKEIREAAPSFLKIMKLQISGDNPKTADFIDAIADFIEDGGALEIKADPKSPVPLSSLAGLKKPDDAASALGLTVTRTDK